MVSFGMLGLFEHAMSAGWPNNTEHVQIGVKSKIPTLSWKAKHIYIARLSIIEV